MIRLIYIILLSVWVLESFAQTPNVSAKSVEKEDSMRLLTILPVHKPKKLVKQIVERLHKDLKQQHEARKYKIEGYFRIDSYPPFFASCTVPISGDNGLEIIENKKGAFKDVLSLMEDFRYEGVENLSQSDSVSVRGKLLKFLLFSPSHTSNNYSTGVYLPSPFVFYDETMRWYKIKAYKISYGLSSVYRVHLEKRKDKRLLNIHDREIWQGDNIDTVYFDCNTLRIKEFKSEFRREDLKNRVERFQVEYDEERGTPVLKQINYKCTNNIMEIKGSVRRINQ